MQSNANDNAKKCLRPAAKNLHDFNFCANIFRITNNSNYIFQINWHWVNQLHWIYLYERDLSTHTDRHWLKKSKFSVNNELSCMSSSCQTWLLHGIIRITYKARSYLHSGFILANILFVILKASQGTNKYESSSSGIYLALFIKCQLQ